MHTLEEIKHALQQTSVRDREQIANWLTTFGAPHCGGYRLEEPPTPAYARPRPEWMTLEEFLESGVEGVEKCEYINGVIRPIVGPSVAHARVTQRLSSALSARLHGGPCEVFSAGLQFNLRIAANEIVYVPDIMVVCEETGWGKNWIHNPKLVVEVLSPSTQNIDKHEKAAIYRRVRHIEEYVIASQDERQVMVHRRVEDWVPRVFTGPAAVAEFASLGLSIPLAEIYPPSDCSSVSNS